MSRIDLYCRVPAKWLIDPSLCWYEWQTIVSGVLALGAAIWAGHLLRKQIRQAEDFRRDEIKHRQTASRIVLPLALASIDEMCRKASSQIAHEFELRHNFEQAFNEYSEQTEARSRFSPIALPDEVIAEMKGFSETLRGRKSTRHVAELMGSIQILISRFNTFDLDRSNQVVSFELPGLLLDVAKVGMLTERMFNFSRFVDNKFAVVGRVANSEAWDMIHKKAESLIFARKIPDVFFEPIRSRISRYKEQGASPWLEKFEG